MDHNDIRLHLNDLNNSDRKVVRSVVAAWDNEKRRLRSGGRPKIMRPCPKCGITLCVRELTTHKPYCQTQ